MGSIEEEARSPRGDLLAGLNSALSLGEFAKVPEGLVKYSSPSACHDRDLEVRVGLLADVILGWPMMSLFAYRSTCPRHLRRAPSAASLLDAVGQAGPP